MPTETVGAYQAITAHRERLNGEKLRSPIFPGFEMHLRMAKCFCTNTVWLYVIPR